MKKIISILFSLILLSQQALATTLFEALTETYKNNTDLNAERENINISEQDLKISKGSYLPTVIISGSKSQEDTSKLTNRAGAEVSVNDVDPFTQSIKVEQTLIDFGRNADIKKNEIGIKIANAKLLKKEQEVLLKAIEAYFGLLLANEKLKINQNNLNLSQSCFSPMTLSRNAVKNPGEASSGWPILQGYLNVQELILTSQKSIKQFKNLGDMLTVNFLEKHCVKQAKKYYLIFFKGKLFKYQGLNNNDN